VCVCVVTRTWDTAQRVSRRGLRTEVRIQTPSSQDKGTITQLPVTLAASASVT